MSSNAVKMIRSDRKITGLDISKRLSSNLDPQLNDLNFNLLYLYTVDPRNNKSSFHLKVFRKKRKLKQKETSRTFCCERKTLNRMESSSNRLLSSFSSKSLCLYLLMILSGLNCFNVDANRRHWTSYNSETQHSLRHHRDPMITDFKLNEPLMNSALMHLSLSISFTSLTFNRSIVDSPVFKGVTTLLLIHYTTENKATRELIESSL
uniref:Uncharacterized protein n=1 Tax=Sarcoptes scabiei TaxID=52283 RepID=A0A834RHF4_SARSC